MTKSFTRLINSICLLLALLAALPAQAQQGGKRIPVQEAITVISKKYNVKFAYEHEIVQGKTTPITTLTAKNLDEALKAVLYPNNLLFIYVSEGNYTLVSRDERLFSPRASGSNPTAGTAQNDELYITGRVNDEVGNSIPGATIKANTSSRAVSTDAQGRFAMFLATNTREIAISYLGYETQSIQINAQNKSIVVNMKVAAGKLLEEVNIVSNGYQALPRERSTGSAVTISSKDIEKIKVSNLVQVLESMVAGVKVNVNAGDNSFLYRNSQIAINSGTRSVGQNDYNMTIRGNSTLSGERFPLVVLDGAITELDLSTINPNDIENITFLKDAAAASIWGTRAANGVIVITNKKGRNNQAPRINFSTTASVSNSPDLGQLNTMNAAQTISYEQELVAKNLIATPNPALSLGAPVSLVTDLLFRRRSGTVSQADFDSQIAMYSARDNKSQISEYLLQPATSQQYNFSVNGGGAASTYFYSASYSKETPYAVGNKGQRLTVNLNNTFTLFNKATLSTSIRGSFFNLQNNGASLYSLYNPSAITFMPYEQLVDDNGNRVYRSNRYYSGWTNNLRARGYLDWGYNALDEIDNTDNTQKDNNYAVNINLNVPIFKGLSATAFFNNERTFSTGKRYYNDDTFYYRDLVNSFTPLPITGNAVNSIGLAAGSGILSTVNTTNNNYTVRGQLAYDNKIGKDHQLTALAGTEIRQTQVGQGINTLYGYNTGTGISRPVNYFTGYPTIQGYNGSLNGSPTQQDKTRRYLSYYGNAAYTYKGKYTLTGSVRYDDYNNFGVDRSLRATPLWSSGLKWDVSKESILESQKWVSNLSLRATYGVNGNISTTIFPFTYIGLSPSDFPTGLPSASIITPANPELRWEKTYVTNIGLDYSLFGNKLNGSIDIYRKHGEDLYYNFPLNGTYGFTNLTRNATEMVGKGIDLSLGAVFYSNKDLDVSGKLNYAYNTNEVTDTRLLPSSALYGNPAYGTVIDGYPNDKVFVYRNAGLDATGMTQVYGENGTIIPINQNVTTLTALKYAGRSTPPHFGSFNTAVRYKEFTLMAIATYQFGNVFLRPTLTSYPTARLGTTYDLHEDVDKRWRTAGDEFTTNVPGVAGIYAAQSVQRYQQSDINVLKGDYIRLRELSLSYNVPVNKITNAVKSANIGFGVRNLGLIWRANKEGIDPDFYTSLNSTSLGLPPTVSYNLSLNVNF
jgi:TonB-linked SusC/RagA family outer membrane protein